MFHRLGWKREGPAGAARDTTNPALASGCEGAAPSAQLANASHSAYRKLGQRRIAAVILLLAVALCSFGLDLVVGPSDLSIAEGLAALFSEDGSRATMIVRDVRLPIALMALLVGAALALAGAEMQTTLNNPLASPFTLGVSSAATFGAALAIVLQFSIPGVAPNWIVPANAFVFSLIAVLLLQLVAVMRGTGTETLVLFGIAIFFCFNAFVAILQFLAGEQALQQLVFWTMGSLGRSDWDKLQILLLVIVAVVPFSMAAAWRMTALRLGEDRARSFGVDVTLLRFGSLLRISMLTATAVAFVGTIAFVGLVGPHIARLLVGEDHRYFLPASMFTGALIMSFSSVASKSIVPGTLVPIGLVTALIGVPFFVTLIIARRM